VKAWKKNAAQRARSDNLEGDNWSSVFLDKVEELQRQKSNGGPRRYQSHPKYKSYSQKVWQVNHPNEPFPGDDDNIVIAPTQHTDIKCPITKLIFENPVINKGCGHSYSKDAILNLLRQNKNKPMACPVTGCSSKITAKSLERDLDMEANVEKEKLKIENNAEEEDEIIDL